MRIRLFVMIVLFVCIVFPSTAQECVPDARFIADITVPDDTVMQAGIDFTKTWRVKNTGACEWTAEYELKFVKDDLLGAITSQQLGQPVAVGESVDISVDMQAPGTPGPYSSTWRLHDGAGNPFGPIVYTRITVETPSEAPAEIEPSLESELADLRARLATTETQRLTALSLSRSGHDNRQALLLALESIALKDTLEGREALIHAVNGYPWRANLVGHTSDINDLAFSPDGHLLASVGTDGLLILWSMDFKYPAKVRVAMGKSGSRLIPPTCLSFSPDGNLLAVGSGSGQIQIWETKAGQLYMFIPGHSRRVNGLAFSPDGKTLASTGDDGLVLVWSLANKQIQTDQVRRFVADAGSAHSVAFTLDSQHLIVGYNDGSIVVWDVAQGKVIRRDRPYRGPSHIHSLLVESDGNLMAIDASRVAINILETSQRAWTETIIWTSPVRIMDAALSPVQELLAVVSADHSLHLLRHSNLARTWTIVNTIAGLDGAPNAVAISPDGQLIATGGCSKKDRGICREGKIQLWDTVTDYTIADYPLNSMGWGVDVSPDGRLVAVGGFGYVSLLDTTGQHVADLRTNESPLEVNIVDAVAFSPNGIFLASGGHDSRIRLWDLRNREVVATLRVNQGPVTNLSFSPDGRFLVSTSWQKDVLVWDISAALVNGGTVLAPFATLSGHTHAVFASAFSSAGDLLATASDDGSVRLWDMTVPKERQNKSEFVSNIIVQEAGKIRGLALSPDDRILAWGQDDGTITLWDIAQRTSLGILSDHHGPINHLAFSPDATLLVSSGTDNKLCVWDVNNRQVSFSLPKPGGVNGLAFSPVSIQAAHPALPDRPMMLLASTGATDWMVGLDLINWDDVAALACRRISQEFNPEEKKLFHLEESENKLCPAEEPSVVIAAIPESLEPIEWPSATPTEEPAPRITETFRQSPTEAPIAEATKAVRETPKD